MTKWKDIEAERVKQQADLDSVKTSTERNQLGQFATPTDLALDILRYSKAILPARERVRFLDPGFGTGAFYSALLHVYGRKRIASAQGFEIDPHYGDAACALWARSDLNLQIGDFTTAAPPRHDAELANLLICNPPYVRHHHIKNGDKARLQRRCEHTCGVRIGGLAGLYCYFMGLAHGWMSDGGVAGWLIPSEFMDVNYGEALKTYLLNKVRLLRIHRFDPANVQFDDALVSSAVVWFRKEHPSETHDVEFSYGGSVMAPSIVRAVEVDVLRREPKWTRFPKAKARAAPKGATLKDLFVIKRGLATGDNSFFILDEAEMEKRGLPPEVLKPVLPSARFIPTDEVDADEEGNPTNTVRRFLLDCRWPEAEVRKRYPRLFAYLEEGKVRGVHDRYLSRHRRPWYAQEDRPPAPLLCTYMGRGRANSKRPFRFILNRSQATATNVYLMLYPRPVLQRQLEAEPSLLRAIWEQLNEIEPVAMIEEGRVYGGGLHKMEPRELGNLTAESITALLSRDVATQAPQAELFEVASSVG